MHTISTSELPTLNELSAIAANNNPNRVAFGNGLEGEQITWRKFDERSRRVATALRTSVAQGDRVAFLCDCSLEHVTLWNGALKAGCIVSNLHTRASPETITYCLQSIRPRVLVIDEEFSDMVEDHLYEEVGAGPDVVATTGEPATDYEVSAESRIADHDAAEPDVRVSEDDVAAIMWTSGTTGRPKGWCHTHRGLAYRGMQLENTLNIERTARQPHVFTPSFAAWYSLVLPALFANASTYFLRDWDPQSFAEIIDHRQLTTAVLIPTMWREVLGLDDLDEYELGSLTRVMTSGEKLDATTLSELRARVCESVYNSYAATEALGTVITNEELDGERIESVGKPVSGTRVRIVERGGPPDAVKEPGEVGEIIIDGPDAPVWVWNDTAKTERVFEDGWWYSGDLGYRDEDGYLFVQGRTDFMIKSKGIKVFPTPIEARLENHPGVERAVVLGVEDEEYGEKVTAVVRRADSGVTASDLDEWFLQSEEVGRFERPRDYRFVDHSFPQTATGKLDRTAIRSMVDKSDAT